MAVACGLGIANLYYNQPLLGQIGREMHADARSVGLLPMLTQIGFAVGVLFIAPLGDILERRRLVLSALVLVTGALLAAALAPSLTWLAVASLAVGIFSVTSTLVLPFAVALARPEERGATVGLIVSALLVGVLGSRTLSGLIGGIWGWRVVYAVAAVLMIVLAAVLRRLLPESRASACIGYGTLLRSMATLFRAEPLLRQATWNGMLCYGALSAFWATLVFFLESPAYRLGPAAAGLFGLVGAGSALAAPLVGRLVDRVSPRTIVGGAVVAMLLSFVAMMLFGGHLAGLIVGVVGLDLAAQTATVSNQATVYSLPQEVHSRLYTVYRAAYSLGGAAGAFLGAWAWSIDRWNGVCLVGVLLLGIALALHGIAQRRAAVHAL
jgi:predicted MFS family arabinose efflux permease